jgi:hypothetical protein
MGTRADGVKDDPEQLEREVRQIRERMEPVVAELDRRRHAFMDWRAQIRQRGPAFLGLAVLVLGGRAAVRAIGRRMKHRGNRRRLVGHA